MDEFASEPEPEPESEPEDRPADVFGGSAFADEDDAAPVVLPDAEEEEPQHSGYNPDGGAISQSSEALGGDEGFIDFGL